MKSIFGILGLLAFGQLSAAVKLPSILSDHAVLTRGRQVPIWGWAEPGEKITVSFHDQSASTTATAAGEWRVDLNLSKSGNGPHELTVTGTNRIIV